MLLFSTILDIERTLTKDDFIKLVIEWNQGSPHESNIIPGINWNGEHNIKYGNEKLWMDIEEYRNKNIIAVRFEKTEEDGAVWDTDYVMNFQEMKMSIRLDRSSALSEMTFVDEDIMKDILADKMAYEEIDEFDMSLMCSVLHCDAHYFTDSKVRNRDLLISTMNREKDTVKSKNVKAKIQDYMNDFTFISEIQDYG